MCKFVECKTGNTKLKSFSWHISPHSQHRQHKHKGCWLLSEIEKPKTKKKIAKCLQLSQDSFIHCLRVGQKQILSVSCLTSISLFLPCHSYVLLMYACLSVCLSLSLPLSICLFYLFLSVTLFLSISQFYLFSFSSPYVFYKSLFLLPVCILLIPLSFCRSEYPSVCLYSYLSLFSFSFYMFCFFYLSYLNFKANQRERSTGAFSASKVKNQVLLQS